MRSNIFLVSCLLFSITSFASSKVYKDSETGLYWNKKIYSQLLYSEAVLACAKLKTLNKEWRLPTIGEFRKAAKGGLKSKFNFDPDYTMNTKIMFWTSSTDSFYEEHKIVFNGYHAAPLNDELALWLDHESADVVCVSK